MYETRPTVQWSASLKFTFPPIYLQNNYSKHEISLFFKITIEADVLLEQLQIFTSFFFERTLNYDLSFVLCGKTTLPWKLEDGSEVSKV